MNASRFQTLDGQFKCSTYYPDLSQRVQVVFLTSDLRGLNFREKATMES